MVGWVYLLIIISCFEVFLPSRDDCSCVDNQFVDYIYIYGNSFLHVRVVIGRVYLVASYKISYSIATSIYDNFIYEFTIICIHIIGWLL